MGTFLLYGVSCPLGEESRKDGKNPSSVVIKGHKLRRAIDGSAGLQILGNPPSFSNPQPQFCFSLSSRQIPVSGLLAVPPALLSLEWLCLAGSFPARSAAQGK